MKYVCIWLVRFYQKFLSPLKGGPTCRFTPSCSAYAIDAFKKRGFFVGFGLTAWRIFRCNPFFKGGYDPVPERTREKRRWKRISKYTGDSGVENNGSFKENDNDKKQNKQ